MEGRALETETVLAGGKLTEVPCGLGDDVVPEPEDDATGGLVVDGNIKLYGAEMSVRGRGKLGRGGDGRPRQGDFTRDLRRRWTW